MKDLKSTQTKISNIRHNLLYSFENSFGTPFETPKGENSLIDIVHPDEIKRHLEEQARENQKTLEAIYAMERENEKVEINNHVRHEGDKGTCSQNHFDDNDGNNTPPRNPRVTIGTFPSPHRQYHHESDEEVTSEDVIKF